MNKESKSYDYILCSDVIEVCNWLDWNGTHQEAATWDISGLSIG